MLLSDQNKRQLWVPEGFGHAFLVTSDKADFLYKATNYYNPSDERCIRWDDETTGIDWRLHSNPHISKRDEDGLPFSKAPLFEWRPRGSS